MTVMIPFAHIYITFYNGLHMNEAEDTIIKTGLKGDVTYYQHDTIYSCFVIKESRCSL